jgi:trimeric autotransporter adhesin
MTRRRYLVLLGIAATLTAATAAWAYWTATGSGAASAGAGTLGAPASLSASATAGASTVHLTWTGSTLSTGQPATGYYATRVHDGDSATAAACGTSPSAPTSATACDDTGVPDGAYHYVVTAVYRTWTASSGSSNDVTVVADATPPSVTLTFPSDGAVYGAGGWTGGCATTGFCGTASDAGGVASVSLSIRQGASGLWWGGASFDQASETFVPASGTTTWSLPFARPADGAYTVHVRAADTAGNTTPSGSWATATFTVDATAPTGSITAPTGTTGGTVAVTSSSADAGSGVAAAQVQVAPHGGSFSNLGAADATSPYQAVWDTTTVANGQYDLRVTTTDAAGNSSTSAIVTVTVSNTFQVTVSSPQTAGSAFTATITARAGSSTNTGYSGSHALSFSGPGTAPDGTHTPDYPGSVTFASGAGTASVTLYKAETPTLTATSGNLSGTSAAFTVSPAAAAQFAVSAGASQTAGAAFTLTSLTARDGYGNTATGYSGSHSITWSGASTSPGGTAPSYPTPSVSFSSGVSTTSLSATLFAAGSNSLTASAASPSVTGTATIAVNAGTSKGLSFTAQSLTGGASESCNAPSTGCTITGLPKNGNGTWTAKVSVIDAWGNPTTASSAVTVTLTRSQNKGSISPTSPLTIASGATASSSFTYTSGNGSSYTETVTASGSGGGVTSTAVTSVTTV